MAFSRRHFRKRSRHGEESRRPAEPGPNQVNPGSTGSEAAYLKSLVDSRAKVTVVMNDGERLSGRVRYYDAECFSLGVASAGPRFLIRKESVCYIEENEKIEVPPGIDSDAELDPDTEIFEGNE